MKGKATWEGGWKGLWGRRLQKRLERGSLSWYAANVFYCICSYTWYITNLYMDIEKLLNHLKLCMLYLFTLDQFLLYFIIQAVSNGLKFIMLQYLIRFHYYLKKLFLQLAPSVGLHFKFWRCDDLVRQRVQGWSEFITEIQPRATDDIYAHYGRLNKEKRKGNILVHMLSDQRSVRPGLHVIFLDSKLQSVVWLSL